ncbi:hypothetical protein BHM03_00057164 [Ensete ventricosum]|nr:hypothetical protein BHM03_00057164 [Ensete ventricosum]
MLEVGETKAHLKQLEVALEMSEDKRQHAEKESSLAKGKAGNAALEVRRLELMLIGFGFNGEYSCTTPCWSRGTEEARLAEGWLSVQGRKVTLLFQGKKG